MTVGALSLDARRSAQGDHVEIHLQRRRVPDPARQVRALPRRRRHRADVADDLRRGVSVGRVDPRRARRQPHAAVERRGRLRRVQARAHAVAARARRHPDVGHRRQPARPARSEAAAGRAEERLVDGRTRSRAAAAVGVHGRRGQDGGLARVRRADRHDRAALGARGGSAARARRRSCAAPRSP